MTQFFKNEKMHSMENAKDKQTLFLETAFV